MWYSVEISNIVSFFTVISTGANCRAVSGFFHGKQIVLLGSPLLSGLLLLFLSYAPHRCMSLPECLWARGNLHTEVIDFRYLG